MSKSLSLQNDSRWETFVTHTLWEGFVVGTLVVNFVAKLLEWHTILALLVLFVLTLTLGLDLAKVLLKTLMFRVHRIFGSPWQTVNTLLRRSMFTLCLDFLHVFLCNTKAVDAL